MWLRSRWCCVRGYSFITIRCKDFSRPQMMRSQWEMESSQQLNETELIWIWSLGARAIETYGQCHSSNFWSSFTFKWILLCSIEMKKFAIFCVLCRIWLLCDDWKGSTKADTIDFSRVMGIVLASQTDIMNETTKKKHFPCMHPTLTSIRLNKSILVLPFFLLPIGPSLKSSIHWIYFVFFFFLSNRVLLAIPIFNWYLL